MFTVFLTVFSLLTGCGPNCQSTCQKIYGDAPDCDIERPGRSQDELISDCMTYCEDALDETGELGDYDPNTRQGSDESISIDNERQAALWMECVTDRACEQLNEGYCAPIW